MTTPRFGISELAEGQSLAFINVNEALQLLDFFAQPRFLGMATNDPPVTPAVGDAYIVGIGTGVWTGEDGNIAIWLGGWRFKPVVTGMFAWDDAGSIPIVFNGSIWKTITVT